ncbi:RidA family protein [Streptosporangium sp. NBC_01755]|uniref:RidA family protein n=1 Tax=unclassified Streptosporangium TaxID=2632669 RepID=UPI002DDA9192|nr:MULTISPECIES: RidA family protein [unclassified Streptosporangium]WSA23606.1 RidA family protein [Streptosporangium sp. NBC_01810]WSC98185.1 RidA family protein [Streptosporangium sp. NBC_01755]
MSSQSELNSNDALLNSGAVRRRLLTGVGAAGVAAVASQLVTPDASAAAASSSRRTDLFYYWKSQQRSLGYSQGVQVDNTLWLSGTAALDTDFNPVSPGDLAAQMQFIYQRIKESLAKYSLDFRHVVRENMYVTDTSALINALPYRKSIYANGPFPTSTTIQVSQLLLPGLMIEIEVTACRALP